MLVLSRYRDESIHIGDDIVVTIVDIRGDRVRLGIQAPASVSVHRQEIYDAIAQGKPAPPPQGNKAKQDANRAPREPKPSERPSGAPMEDKLASHRSKGLPIDIDNNPISFGGMTDAVGS